VIKPLGDGIVYNLSACFVYDCRFSFW